jgi:hypothetical protein
MFIAAPDTKRTHSFRSAMVCQLRFLYTTCGLSVCLVHRTPKGVRVVGHVPAINMALLKECGIKNSEEPAVRNIPVSTPDFFHNTALYKATSLAHAHSSSGLMGFLVSGTQQPCNAFGTTSTFACTLGAAKASPGRAAILSWNFRCDRHVRCHTRVNTFYLARLR